MQVLELHLGFTSFEGLLGLLGLLLLGMSERDEAN
jgi:hypothetical protein